MIYRIGRLICVMIIFIMFCEDSKKIILSHSFKNNSTYIIEAKGYPKDGINNPIQKMASARSAAEINAQTFARTIFTSSIDPIKNGYTKNIIMKSDHAIVTYIIQHKTLKKCIKKRN